MLIGITEINKMQKPCKIITGSKALKSIIKLTEFVYKESQSRFIPVSISLVNQSSGNCIINYTDNFAIFGCGSLFRSFGSKVANSSSELCAICFISISLYCRSLYSFLTGLMLRHKCILSIYKYVYQFNTTSKYNRQIYFVNR